MAEKSGSIDFQLSEIVGKLESIQSLAQDLLDRIQHLRSQVTAPEGELTRADYDMLHQLLNKARKKMRDH